MPPVGATSLLTQGCHVWHRSASARRPASFHAPVIHEAAAGQVHDHFTPRTTCPGRRAQRCGIGWLADGGEPAADPGATGGGAPCGGAGGGRARLLRVLQRRRDLPQGRLAAARGRGGPDRTDPSRSLCLPRLPARPDLCRPAGCHARRAERRPRRGGPGYRQPRHARAIRDRVARQPPDRAPARSASRDPHAARRGLDRLPGRLLPLRGHQHRGEARAGARSAEARRDGRAEVDGTRRRDRRRHPHRLRLLSRCAALSPCITSRSAPTVPAAMPIGSTSATRCSGRSRPTQTSRGAPAASWPRSTSPRCHRPCSSGTASIPKRSRPSTRRSPRATSSVRST